MFFFLIYLYLLFWANSVLKDFHFYRGRWGTVRGMSEREPTKGLVVRGSGWVAVRGWLGSLEGLGGGGSLGTVEGIFSTKRQGFCGILLSA